MAQLIAAADYYVYRLGLGATREAPDRRDGQAEAVEVIDREALVQQIREIYEAERAIFE